MFAMIPRLRSSGTATFCLLALAVILLTQLGGPAVMESLRWDRGALQEFELWRLLTGHLVHASWPHLGLNALGLALIGWLFPEPVSLGRQLARFVWLSLLCSLMMYWWVPELGWYVGMSGVLHGSFVLGLWWLYRQGDWLAAVLLVILLVKLVWEHFHGPISSDEDLVGVPVLTQAHSFGAAGAILWLLLGRGVDIFRRSRDNAAP